MKIAEIIANYLLAIIFITFALNYFFKFLPMPPLEGTPKEFMGILVSTGFMTAVKIIELIISLMMIFWFKRALAYILLAPIVVNIFMYDVFISGQLALGLPVLLILLFLLIINRSKYRSIYAND